MSCKGVPAVFARYTSRCVDLDVFSFAIRSFFEKRGFDVEEHVENGERYLFARLKRTSKTVEIILAGRSEDLTVEGIFVPDKDRVPKQVIPSIFGGGIFMLHELRWRETLLKLEQDFSAYLDNLVTELVRSDVRARG